MPGSVQEGKDLVKEFCIESDVRTVLDIGPGEGTYYYALQDTPVEILQGVEVWGPYIDDFNLKEKYNNIYISNVYYLDWDKLDYHTWDMVILGDIIEHLPRNQGEDVIRRAVDHSRYVVVSLPIYGYAQNVTMGNTYETHVEQYSDESIREVLKEYEILESLKGEVVGVYIFTKRT